MRDFHFACLGVLLLSGARADAQSPAIDHQPVACATAEKFPRLEARFSPAETVATARVVFQGQNPEWYSVAMKPEGAAFVGVLPKPKKSLKSFRYYIEVTDKALGTNRTADYTTEVVDSSSACKGKVMAATLASASVLIQGPAGVVALPVGFASTGVVVAGSAAGSSAGAAGGAVGGGGGLSGGAVAGIIGGAGAVAAGVAVAANKGGGEGSSGTSYSGSFSGQLSMTLTATGGGGGTVICGGVFALTGTMKITLDPSNGGATGQGETAMTETQTGKFGDPGCGTAPGPRSFTEPIRCPVSGTPGDLACSVQTSEGIRTLTFRFSGALSAGVISGTATYGRTDDSGSTTGSTTFPVTLR